MNGAASQSGGSNAALPQRAMVVALTGGIAAGKSLVASLFAEQGIEQVDTDQIAHALTDTGGAALPDLMSAFGADILDARGALDRANMRSRVFADPAERARLEGILHPRIREAAQAALAAVRSPYALLAIPLYVESGAGRPPVDRVLVVDCPEALQRQRALSRPGLLPAQLDGILAVQATRAERLAAADDVIDNEGDLDSLRHQVLRLHAQYLRLAGGHQ